MNHNKELMFLTSCQSYDVVLSPQYRGLRTVVFALSTAVFALRTLCKFSYL